MKIQSKINIKNVFKIEVRDKVTNKLKQSGVAHNIILNRGFSQVSGSYGYFSYIHFGTGDGVVNPSRTSLFSPLGYRSASMDSSENAYPISYVTKKITLNPEEYVDKIITEVGISEGTASSYLNTHALIKDAEGNPLSILKTDLDVLIIYATVFVEFTNPSSEFKWIGFPNNAMANYFIQHSNVPNIIASDTQAIFNSPSAVSLSATRTPGVRKHTTFRRFGITEQNKNIRYLMIPSTLGIKLPATEFEGYQLTNVPIGIGDGVTKTFNLPMSDPHDTAIKNNDNIVINYTETEKVVTGAIAQVFEGNSFNMSLAATSKNGNFIVRPYRETGTGKPTMFCVYEKVESEYIVRDILELPPATQTAYANNVISEDGEMLIIADEYRGHVVNKYNSTIGKYEKIQTLRNPLQTNGYAASTNLSADKKRLVLGNSWHTFFDIYQLNEISGEYEFLHSLQDTGTTVSSTHGYTSSAMSSTGEYLVVTVDSLASPRVYKFDTDTQRYIFQQQLPGTSNSRCVDGSADLQIISFATYKNPSGAVYRFNSGTQQYDKLQDLTIGETIVYVAVSETGQYIYQRAGNPSADGNVYIYEWDTEEEIFKKINASEYPEFTASKIFVSGPEGLFVYRNVTAPQWFYYENQKIGRSISFDVAPQEGAVLTMDAFVPYIPKTKDYVLDVTFEILFGEGV